LVLVNWYMIIIQSGTDCPGQGGGCGERVRVHWYTMNKQSGDEWPDPAPWCRMIDFGEGGSTDQECPLAGIQASCSPRQPCYELRG